jgi:hypothetical protein
MVGRGRAYNRARPWRMKISHPCAVLSSAFAVRAKELTRLQADDKMSFLNSELTLLFEAIFAL